MPNQNQIDEFDIYNSGEHEYEEYDDNYNQNPHYIRTNDSLNQQIMLKNKSNKRALIVSLNIFSVVLLALSGFLSYKMFSGNFRFNESDIKGKSEEIQDAQKVVQKIDVPVPENITSNTLFFGDVFWGRRMNNWSQSSQLKEAFPFSGLNSFEREKYDAWIANLECPITDQTLTKYEEETLLKFNCRPEYLAEARKYFNVFGLSNNHTNNMEEFEGLKQTRENLEKNDIQYFGHFDNAQVGDLCEVINLPAKAIYNPSDLNKVNRLKNELAKKETEKNTQDKNLDLKEPEQESLENLLETTQMSNNSTNLNLEIINQFDNQDQINTFNLQSTEENSDQDLDPKVKDAIEKLKNKKTEENTEKSDLETKKAQTSENLENEEEYVFSNPEDFVLDYKIPVAMCGYHNVFKLPTEEELQEIAKYSQHFITIVMPHQGAEYTTASDGLQKQYFRKMIDLGADFVIGGHTHSMNETESYNGKLIAYSLGNFIFDQQANQEVTTSYGMNLNFKFKYDKNISELQSLIEECKISEKDCLEIAKERDIKKPNFEVEYDLIGSQNDNQITKKADPERMQFILQRTNWENVKPQLKTQF
jgi:hypothetical protein